MKVNDCTPLHPLRCRCPEGVQTRSGACDHGNWLSQPCTWPWVLSSGNAFGGHGKVKLKTGDCYQRRFVNKDSEAIQVKIYDWIHSQERFIVTVLPGKR